jgi:TPR repeat protein/V8-like Glu-specific endopeptidase
VKWYRKSADQGDAVAQFLLGAMYENGEGVAEDDAEAVKWYRKSADQGDAVAQFLLGAMYENGEGVAEDEAEAVKWYRKSADQGDADAQNSLGISYALGRGVAQDYVAAYEWWLKAAKQELANAQLSLGYMYRGNDTGTFSDTEFSKDFERFKLDAEEGDLDSQTSIGFMLTQGYGVAVNHQEAQKWFRNAADQGYPFAQFNLGWMYENGEGATRDDAEAVKWYSKAAEQGLPGAKAKLVKVETKVAAAKRKEEEHQSAKSQPKQNQPPTSSGSGSGFFVSKLGHVVTNEHVVRNCGSVTIGDSANKQVRAKVLATDKRNDLALLKLSSTDMASADTKSLIQKLGIQVVPLSSNGLLRSDDVELGERLMVAGYPFGDIFSDTIKVTGGMVSATKGWGDDSRQFQMDAAVQPGNSGGPVYDENGSIVGVVVAQADRRTAEKTLGVLPENVNFGIKASTLRQFLTTNSLPTKWSQRSERMSSRDIAKIAKNQTVMVVCGP